MKCDNCQADVSPVFDHPDGWDKQIDNGLVIRVYDGYGMFTDVIYPPYWPEDDTFEMVFCHDCCVKLFDEFPAFAKRLTEVSGSADRNHPCGLNPCKYGY